MPKINAATVAEHRERQRQALLSAAAATLVESGAAALTPAAVGARAGLARSSVYQYFPSTTALIEAVIETEFPRWNAEVHADLAGVTAPADRIAAYFGATLRLTAAGRHRAATALLGANLPPEARLRLAVLHRETYAPLAAAVAELGHPDPEVTVRLLGGLLQAAMAEVEAGTDVAVVQERLRALVSLPFAGSRGVADS